MDTMATSSQERAVRWTVILECGGYASAYSIKQFARTQFDDQRLYAEEYTGPKLVLDDHRDLARAQVV